MAFCQEGLCFGLCSCLQACAQGCRAMFFGVIKFCESVLMQETLVGAPRCAPDRNALPFA